MLLLSQNVPGAKRSLYFKAQIASVAIENKLSVIISLFFKCKKSSTWVRLFRTVLKTIKVLVGLRIERWHIVKSLIYLIFNEQVGYTEGKILFPLLSENEQFWHHYVSIFTRSFLNLPSSNYIHYLRCSAWFIHTDLCCAITIDLSGNRYDRFFFAQMASCNYHLHRQHPVRLVTVLLALVNRLNSCSVNYLGARYMEYGSDPDHCLFLYIKKLYNQM